MKRCCSTVMVLGQPYQRPRSTSTVCTRKLGRHWRRSPLARSILTIRYASMWSLCRCLLADNVCHLVQLEHLIQDFRTSQDKLAEVKERHKGAGSSVTELSRELAQVTDELEGVKAEMDEKGTSMTDAGPLVKVKQALTRLKNESTEMQVRIGVVSLCTVMGAFFWAWGTLY